MSTNGKPVTMEINTGASVSTLNENAFESVFVDAKPTLSKHTDAELCTYTGQKMPVVGSCTVAVEHNNRNVQLPLLIVSGRGPNLLGRNWLRNLQYC